MKQNTFRHVDALEYAAAWNACTSLGVEEIECKALALNRRMDAIEKNGEPIPSYLLAAFRAYESAIIFRTNPIEFSRPDPFIVILSAID